MKTYVIHYKQAPERREHIEKSFGYLDLEFCDKYDKTMVPDWKNPESVYKVFPEMKKWFPPKLITINHTFASHCVAMTIIDVLQKIKDEPALILEDDAVPMVPNYKDRISECITNAPPDWDILFISDSRCGSDLRRFTRGIYGTEWLKVLEMRSTCAWLVSPTGAHKLLELAQKHGALGMYRDSYFDNWMSRIIAAEQSVDVWWSICPFVCNGDQVKAFDITY